MTNIVTLLSEYFTSRQHEKYFSLKNQMCFFVAHLLHNGTGCVCRAKDMHSVQNHAIGQRFAAEFFQKGEFPWL